MSGEPVSRFAWAAAFQATEAELEVAAAAAVGLRWTFSEPTEIRSVFLRILLLGLRRDWPVAPAGVRLAGEIDAATGRPLLTIAGPLDLEHGRSEDGGSLPPLSINNAFFDSRIMMSGCHIADLNLDGCRNLQLFGLHCTIDGDVCLNQVRCVNLTALVGARIGGSLTANFSCFENRGGISFAAKNAVLGGGAGFYRTRFLGEAVFTGIQMRGDFSANDCRFLRRRGKALQLDHADIGGGVYLFDSRVYGELDAGGARTGGHFLASGARLRNRRETALHLQDAKIGGDVSLMNVRALGDMECSNLRADGGFSAAISRFICHDRRRDFRATLRLANAVFTRGVSLDSARIVGFTDCAGIVTGASFSATDLRCLNRGRMALTLDHAKIGGHLIFDHYRGYGQTVFAQASVEGNLTAKHARFLHARGMSLQMNNGARMRGVFLCGARFSGETNAGLSHFSDLYLSEAIFDSRGAQNALMLAKTEIESDLILADSNVDGRVYEAASLTGALVLNDAKIGRNLLLTGASFAPAGQRGPAVSLRRAIVDGALEMHSIVTEREGFFDFGDARIDRLDDDPIYGWPAPGLLNLDGLVYRAVRADLGGARDRSLTVMRIAWLKRQYAGGAPGRYEFRPQPFEQLASVLRAQGYEYAATQVAIEKREMQRKSADRGFARFLHTILKITSDYGYSPARALLWFACWVAVGAVMARLALERGMIEWISTDVPEALHVEPIAYAFDLATPIIDFGQASAYRLKPQCFETFAGNLCGALELAEVGYSTFGFILFSILVLTLTGVLRREE